MYIIFFLPNGTASPVISWPRLKLFLNAPRTTDNAFNKLTNPLIRVWLRIRTVVHSVKSVDTNLLMAGNMQISKFKIIFRRLNINPPINALTRGILVKSIETILLNNVLAKPSMVETVGESIQTVPVSKFPTAVIMGPSCCIKPCRFAIK